MALPHELLPWLRRNKVLPEFPVDYVRGYWEHHKSHGSSWASVADGIQHKCLPMYLWADDAEYNESHEKLVVAVMGCVLDERTFSMETVFPLWTIREAP